MFNNMKVQIELLKQTYAIDCNEQSVDMLYKSAEELNRFLANVVKNTPPQISDINVAMLAALNIASINIEKQSRIEILERQLTKFSRTVGLILNENDD